MNKPCRVFRCEIAAIEDNYFCKRHLAKLPEWLQNAIWLGFVHNRNMVDKGTLVERLKAATALRELKREALKLLQGFVY